MRNFAHLTAILLALCAIAQAESPLVSTTYTASQASLLVTAGLDIHSSYNKPELNPLLASDGRLGNKGVAISVGLTVGVVALQRVVDRKLDPRNRTKARKIWTVGNFVLSGIRAGVVARNYRR